MMYESRKSFSRRVLIRPQVPQAGINALGNIVRVIQNGLELLADLRNWPPMGSKSLSGYQKKKLFHNERGELFKEEAARHGLDSVRDGRGIAVADLDNDGRLDLFVTNANAEPHLYHNTLPAGAHWAEFLLEGAASNRAAVGAQLRLTAGGRTYLRFVNGGNGFASQSTLRVHFGLGSSAMIDRVEVGWPSGKKQVLQNLAADKIYKLVEGSPQASLLAAKASKK